MVSKSRWSKGLSDSQRRQNENRVRMLKWYEKNHAKREYRIAQQTEFTPTDKAGLIAEPKKYRVYNTKTGYGSFTAVKKLTTAQAVEFAQKTGNHTVITPKAKARYTWVDGNFDENFPFDAYELKRNGNRYYLEAKTDLAPSKTAEKLADEALTNVEKNINRIKAKQVFTKAAQQVGKGLILQEATGKIVDKGYGWYKGEYITKDNEVQEFNIRKSDYEKWARKQHDWYSSDTVAHMFHQWEKNYIKGHIQSLNNRIHAIVKAYRANGMETEATQVERLTAKMSPGEKEAFLNNWYENELPNLPEDFFEYKSGTDYGKPRIR